MSRWKRLSGSGGVLGVLALLVLPALAQEAPRSPSGSRRGPMRTGSITGLTNSASSQFH
jgi:hypothetical protein